VKTQAVLFDLDGTFADTAPDLGEALNYLRSLRKLPPLPLGITRLQASHGSAGLIKLGLNIERTSSKFPPLQEAFLAYYSANICVQTTLFPGIEALINTLEQRGLPWGIVTNKPQQLTLQLMHALGYFNRAACIVSGDTCAHAKPHPEPLLYAAERLGIAPQNCIYVGDDKRDMVAGQAAGMKSFIALYGYIDPLADLDSWQATGRIKSPNDLILQLI